MMGYVQRKHVRCRNVLPAAGALFGVLLAACASVPSMPDPSDTAAKKFEPQPGLARIYIYRNESFGGGIPMPVALNNQMIGITGPRTYLMVDVAPGRHILNSHAENDSTLAIDTEAGRLYFVWQEVKGGRRIARSELREVDATAGRKGVMECRFVYLHYVPPK